LKKKKQSLLWEVSLSGQTEKSYVFGTMHVKSKRVFSAFDQITHYIDSCASFCLEIDAAESSSMEMQHMMMLPGHQTLQGLLKPKEFSRLERILAQLGGPPIMQLNRVRPMHLINLLSSLIMVEETNQILDLSLFQYAEQQGKRTFGIETKEEHIKILASLNHEIEIRQLKAIIHNFSSFKRQHHSILEDYIHGRIDKLFLRGKKSLGKWRKMLLKDRNYKMASRLQTLAQEESIFCAIGAGHLYGKFGVLRLLKVGGAKIKPFQLDFE